MRKTAISLLVLAATVLTVGQALPQGNVCHNPGPLCGGGSCIPPPEEPPPCRECEPRTCPNCTGSPGVVRSGGYITNVTDLSLPTLGLPLEFSRKYKSTRVITGTLGYGWTSNVTAHLYYATYLFSAPSTYQKEADLLTPDGMLFRFVENTDGTFSPPAGRSDLLIKNPDGSFDLRYQAERTVYRFSATGNLTGIVDEFGRTTIFTYDAQDRLQQVADGSGTGRYINVFWGANGRVSSLQDQASRTVQYGYDTQGRLLTVTDPAGRVTTYSYVAGKFSPLLSQIQDSWNRVLTSITYDAAGRLLTYTENGETYTYTYNYQGNADRVGKADSQGNTWVYQLQAEKFLLTDRTSPTGGGTVHTDFNADGTTQQRTDEGGIKTAYTYFTSGDSKNYVATMTQNHQAASGTPTVRWDYAYDATYPYKVSTITPKNPATGGFDPNWQGSKYDYYTSLSDPNPGGLHHVYRLRNDGTTLDTLQTYVYDSQKRLSRETTGGGVQTDYTYDGSGNLQTVTQSANNTAGTRPVTTYAYDSAGRVTSVTDPLGKATTYTYDALGRALTVTLPPPSAGSDLTFVTTYSYDNYDVASGLTFTHVTDPNGKLTKLGYDQYGRLIRSIDALTNTTTYGYTRDLLTSITDANNNVTSYSYNGLKQLTQTTFSDGNAETYTYRSDGLLATKVDRRSTTVTYGYDALKRLATKTYSSGGAITYTYQGQKLTQVADTTLSPNEAHTFSYDAAYRMATNAQASRGNVNYTYGADDRPATIGVSGGHTATYAYYADGSVKTIDWTPVSGHFTYAYTLRGQYASVSFPNSQTRTYTYDDQGRLTQLANALGSTNLAAYAYGYDINNLTGQSTMLGQRTSLTATVPSQSFSGALSKYYYDSLYQLTKVDYPSASPFSSEVDSWTYDAIGNRLTETVNGTPTSYSYFKNGANPLNGQRLQTAGATSYTYDAAGNQATRSGGTTFGYDSENRLSSISGAATYTYDYQGRRASKSVGGVTTIYLYDGVNLVAETAGGVTGYFLNGQGIDEPLAVSKSGTIAYFDVDSLGSTTLTNDAAGNVTLSTVFDAWGTSRSETGTRNHPFTYTGRETGDGGLLFYRARFLDPTRGAFTQEDPLSNPGGFAQIVLTARTLNSTPMDSKATSGGMNLGALIRKMPAYTYVASNPVDYTDPTGLYCCNQSFGDCLGECLKLADPLPGWLKAPLLPGGTFPKWWLGFPRSLGSSPLTTVGSTATHAAGGSSGVAGVGRALGRVLSPVWIAYGTAMFGLEVYCAVACASDHCMFLP